MPCHLADNQTTQHNENSQKLLIHSKTSGCNFVMTQYPLKVVVHLIRVAFAVWHHSSNFMGMLQRLTNCHFITIILNVINFF